MRRSGRSSKRSLLIVGILGFGLAVLWAVKSVGPLLEPIATTKPNNAWKIKQVGEDYSRAKPVQVDRWWLTTTPEATIETRDLLEGKKAEILKIFEAYRPVSPEVAKIATRFQDLRAAVWRNGQAQFLTAAGEDGSLPPAAMTVCFLTRAQAEQSEVFVPQFPIELGVILIPGVEIPAPLYAAVLLHEFGHALRHNKFDGDPSGSESEEARIKEEVEMHELSGVILNVASRGRYYPLVNEVVGRVAGAPNFESAPAALTAADYDRADALFGCAATNIPSRLLTTHLQLMVSFRFCEQHSNGADKVAVYRWFEENIFITSK